MARRKQVRRPGEGTVYQRKDGRFVFEVTLEDHSRKPYYFKTEKEALDKQLEVRMQIAQGTLATGPQQTVKQLLEHWFEDVYRFSNIRVRTLVGNRVVVYKHLIPGLGHLKLQKLTVQGVQSFYGKKMKSGTSASRIKTIHTVLNMALDYARRTKLVSVNVCSDVRLPKQQEKERQILTPEQAKSLLDQVKEHRLEMLLLLALATGMREGELLALRWSDVDFHTGMLSIGRTVQHIAGYGFVENEPKTAKGRRKIVLPQFVLDALTQHHVEQLKRRLEMGVDWNSRNLVFPETNGNFMYAVTLWRRFRKVLLMCGLPRITFHDLRHSATTLLLLMGVPPKVVQEILGHSDIRITMNIYSHVLPSMQKEAAEKMNKFFDSSSS